MRYIIFWGFAVGMSVLWSCETGSKTTTAIRSSKTYPAFIGTYTKKEGHVDGQGEGIYLYQLDSATGYLDRLGVVEGIVNPSFLTLSADGQYLYAVEEIGADVDEAGRVVAYRRTESGLERINQQSTFAFAPCHVRTDAAGKYVFVANYVGSIAVYPTEKNGGLKAATYRETFQGKGPHARQDAPHPHSVNLSPDGQYLYVPDLGTDQIHSYQVNYTTPDQPLRKIGATKLKAGAGPRHFTFHPQAAWAYVVNELNCTVTVLNWDQATGKLDTVQSITTLPQGFTGPNTCSDLHITPDGRFLYAANRGHNSIVGYQISPTDGQLRLIDHQSTQGEVPRNFAIAPDGRFVYVANQNSDNIIILSVEADGRLKYRKEEKVPTPVCIQFGK